MKKQRKTAQTGEVRIIAGRWRGRKLPVLTAEGLRPTGDRIKETLFNWLMGEVPDLQVLDCFAGSGALGFEALSRGAKSVLFLERDKVIAQNLCKNLQLLQISSGVVKQIDSLQFLANPSTDQRFDLIFVDPPFHFDLASKTLQLLEHHHWLNPNAWVYVETEKDANLSFSSLWQRVKEKTTGQVCYRLYRYLGD